MPTALAPSNPASLPAELLQYLFHYKVVVCTSCRYAIQPNAIARHLKEIHRMRDPERQIYMQHLTKLERADSLVVMQYVPDEFPVPLLPVYSGLQCKYEKCAHLCLTEKRMKHHWLSVHRRQGLGACDWQAAPLQTFFKGNLLQYFTDASPGPPVRGVSSQAPSVDWIEQLPDPSPSSTTLSTTSSRTLHDSDNTLMHHFIRHTSLTLATDEINQQMWHVVVAQLAYQHEFLMQALLACTELHMAYVNPKQHSNLATRAMTHQNHAFTLFRAEVPTIERENCDAAIVFARVVSITAFAFDEHLDMDGKGDYRLPSWLFFIRSGCTMLCDVWAMIGTGPVRYLAESWELLVNVCESPDQELINYLLAIIPYDWPEAVRVPYSDSALALARTFSCLLVLDGERITMLDVLRFWPIKNSVEFVDLLDNWHPGALILLAYYCIVLQRMQKRCWYIGGHATRILSTIMRQLDPQWHRYIEWPLSEVGLLQSTTQMTNKSPIGLLALSSDAGSSLVGAVNS